MKPFVAAYDSRQELPEYVDHFVEQTLRHVDLHFLVPSDCSLQKVKNRRCRENRSLHVVDVGKLSFWQETKDLFHRRFINYSTNSSDFERSCFDRWFAINIATEHLDGDQYICQLDSDFLIGMNPADLLKLCRSHANGEVDLIAEWECESRAVISPAITILKKKTLFLFCEFILTEYYKESARELRVKEYFSRIGMGLPGGVCDMLALGSFLNAGNCRAFNLGELKATAVIRNLNEFRNAHQIEGTEWTLLNHTDRQSLAINGSEMTVIGIHCQGSAKHFMRTIVENGILTEDLCRQRESDLQLRPQLLSRAARKLVKIAGGMICAFKRW